MSMFIEKYLGADVTLDLVTGKVAATLNGVAYTSSSLTGLRRAMDKGVGGKKEFKPFLAYDPWFFKHKPVLVTGTKELSRHGVKRTVFLLGEQRRTRDTVAPVTPENRKAVREYVRFEKAAAKQLDALRKKAQALAAQVKVVAASGYEAPAE